MLSTGITARSQQRPSSLDSLTSLGLAHFTPSTTHPKRFCGFLSLEHWKWMCSWMCSSEDPLGTLVAGSGWRGLLEDSFPKSSIMFHSLHCMNIYVRCINHTWDQAARCQRSLSTSGGRPMGWTMETVWKAHSIWLTQTLMGPHMEGSDPHMEGSGVSNP